MFVYSPNDQLAIHASISYDMKLKGDLCDVTIKVEDRSFPAHRIILASAIPYFRVMFTIGMVETNRKEINLESQEAKFVEALINYAYGKTIGIERRDVHLLLQTSDFMEVKEVRDACQEFLLEGDGLDSDNVVNVLKVADRINQQCLFDRSLLYIRNHFEDLSKGGHLLNLPYEYLEKIIGSDTLDVVNEEAVFEIVIKWVKASTLERHPLLPDLLNKVRMTQLPLQFLLDRVASERLIVSSIRCQELVKDIKKYHDSNGQTVLPTSSNNMPRKLHKDHTLYFVTVNDSGWRAHCYTFYPAGKNNWQYLGNSSGVSDGKIFYVAVVDQKIYVFLSKTTQIFHLRNEVWEVLNNAEPWITGAVIVLHRNVIYAFGSDKSGFRRSVHRFDAQHNKWKNYGTIATEQDCLAAASLEDYIYIIGPGFCNRAHEYNPINGKLKQIASVPGLVLHPSCAGVNGKLYVFEHWVYAKRTGQVYDRKTNTWSFIAPVNAEPYHFSLVPSSNGIYKLGMLEKCACTSCTGCKMVCEVHRYDIETDEWNSRFLHTEIGSNECHDIFLAVCS